MKVEKAEKGAAKDNRLWLMILAALGAVIVILVTVIVIIAVNKNAAVKFGGSKEELEEAKRVHDSYIITINARLAGVSANDEDLILDVYDDYINAEKNEAVKAMLLSDYYQIVMNYDINKEKKDEVLNNFLDIDGLLKTISSAIMVTNAAGYYEDDILFERYDNIIKERELAEGIDINGGSEG